jgi:hypothetical protein
MPLTESVSVFSWAGAAAKCDGTKIPIRASPRPNAKNLFFISRTSHANYITASGGPRGRGTAGPVRQRPLLAILGAFGQRFRSRNRHCRESHDSRGGLELNRVAKDLSGRATILGLQYALGAARDRTRHSGKGHRIEIHLPEVGEPISAILDCDDHARRSDFRTENYFHSRNCQPLDWRDPWAHRVRSCR